MIYFYCFAALIAALLNGYAKRPFFTLVLTKEGSVFIFQLIVPLCTTMDYGPSTMDFRNKQNYELLTTNSQLKKLWTKLFIFYSASKF